MVFIVLHATLVIFYLRETVPEIKELLVRVIVFNGIIFIGGALVKDFIRSKWFQPGMKEVDNETK